MQKSATTPSNRHPLATTLAALVLGSATLSLGLATAAPSEGHTPSTQRSESFSQADLHITINTVLGLESSTLLTLEDLPVAPGVPIVTQISVDGIPVTLDLVPHSVRAEEYQVLVQVDDGSLIEVEPQPVRTMQGMLQEIPGSRASGSLHEEGLHASVVLPDGRNLWLQPVAAHVPGAPAGSYVLYDAADADCGGGTCGVPDEWLHDIADVDLEHFGHEGGIAGENCYFVTIAADADFQYFQIWGSVEAVENQINLLINNVNNNQYEQQTGIIHQVGTIIVRTSSNQPYTSTNPGTLLSQFRNTWNSPPESQIPRHLAHLFTGKNLQGSTIGIAYLATVCQQPPWGQAYALSQHLNNQSCMSDLVAHEIGHNWSAGHCSCPSTTMNPSLTCANSFAQVSINQIINYRNSANCPTPCSDAVVNNHCDNRIVVTDGDTPFSNVGATTTGPNEPEQCEFIAGDSSIDADIWYEYTATATGMMTVSLCNSGFPTKLGIYEGNVCPTQDNSITDCDLASCSMNTRSEIIMPVIEGEVFIIRVGGRNYATGEGTLSISTEEISEPVCEADLNGNGVVDVFDLLILLGDWGECPGCDADLNGDGTVDVFDLLALLSDWGPCE